MTEKFKPQVLFLIVLVLSLLQVPSVYADNHPTPMGILSVDTGPVKGEVFVDGVSWGIAPRGREVAVGNYTVSFGFIQYYMTPTAVDVEVFQNQTSTVIGNYTQIRVAYFIYNNLTMTPPVVEVGNPVTINVSVVNVGDLSGLDHLFLIINDTQVESTFIQLQAQGSKTASFTYTPADEGFHRVILRLSYRDVCEGNFTVIPIQPTPAEFIFDNLQILPEEVTVGEDYTISLWVINTGVLDGTSDIYLTVNETDYFKVISLSGGKLGTVTFTLTATTVGIFVITVNGLTGSIIVNPVDSSPSNLLYIALMALIASAVAFIVIIRHLNRRGSTGLARAHWIY